MEERAPMWRRLARLPIISSVTSLGWTIASVAVVAFVGAWRLGWEELAVMSASCLVLLLVALLFTLGRQNYAVGVELRPKRLTVGEHAVGALRLSNRGRRRALPSRLEVRVGSSTAQFAIPMLAPGHEHEELFTVPTARRGVIPVGPALSVRGDPLGLARTERVWSEPEELFVHPRTVGLDRVGTGFLKDLEGHTTNDLTQSDVAFHTLRAYVPGDDRRHVHWKTSAKTGTIMVRQYVDTRRSHLGLVVSGAEADYASEAEFELALSMAASFALRALRDEQEVSVVIGAKQVPSANGQQLLDAMTRVERGGAAQALGPSIVAANACLAQASIVALCVGSTVPLADVRAASNRLVSAARTIIVRADEGGVLAFRPVANSAVINVPTLEELAQGLVRATRA